MKVIYILGSLNRTAPNTVILNIILNLNLQKIKIISLNKSIDDNYKSFLEEKNIEYKEYHSFKYAFINLIKIKKELQEYDIIHLNTYHPNVYGWLLKNIGLEKKYLSTCHAVENQEAVSSNKRIKDKIKSFLRLNIHSVLYPKQNKVVAVSNQVEVYLKEIGCKNSTTIYNGIDYSSFPEMKFKKLDKSFLDLCQVGHVINRKNQIFSIDLVINLKRRGLNVKLHLFGSYDKNSEYYKYLQKIIIDNQIEENIIFYGSLQFDELFEKLQDMDIQLLPSLSEGLPLTLLESFYFKLPAIVSRNGGMKEVVQDYKNGLIVDISTQKDFKKIYDYINNKTFIKDGETASEIALKSHSANYMANNYMDEYQRLLGDL